MHGTVRKDRGPVDQSNAAGVHEVARATLPPQHGECREKVNDATAWAHEIFLDPSRDEAAIRQAAKAHCAAFDELLDTALETRKDINAVLNADQLAKLPALKPTSK